MTQVATDSRRLLGELLLAVGLVFLAVGRIQFEVAGLELKVGENIENLLPLLLLGGVLCRPFSGPSLGRALSPFAAGFLLLLFGTLVGLFSQLSPDALQDFLRLLGQALCGFLLARWVASSGALERWPGVLWMAGHALLLWRTPWGDPTNPNLEGPFPHRNFQSAFFLLAFPTLAFIGLGGGTLGLARLIPAAALVAAELFFVIRFQSRAGLLGCSVCAAMLAFLLSRPERSRLRLILPLLAVAALVAVFVVVLAPRLGTLGQEFGNPYERSRVGIWTAAVDGWRNPANWLRGIGMGDEFDRILADSPTGNLNYHYRRAHYPHSLYLQWLYWGGIMALVGWFAVLAGVWRCRVARPDDWRVILPASALFGYAAMEVFDASIRDPRVSALLWFDIGLLACWAHQPSLSGQESRGEEWNGVKHSWAQLLPLYLPLAWVPMFTFRETLGVLVTALFVWTAGSPFFHDWLRAGEGNAKPGVWRRIAIQLWSLLATALLVQLYLPALPKSWLAPGPALLMGGLCLLLSFSRQGDAASGGMGAPLHLGLGFPLALGGGLMLCLDLSPLDLPEAFLPSEGLATALGLSLALWGLWRFLALQVGRAPFEWGPFGPGVYEIRSLVVAGLVVLSVLLRAIGVETSRQGLLAREEGDVRSWELLIHRAKALDLRGLENQVRASALASAGVRREPDRWVSLAKDSSVSLINEENTSLFARFLARGGKALPEDYLQVERDEAVGLALDWNSKRFLMLTAGGRLVILENGIRAAQLVAEASPFAHCRLDREGNLFALEARGALHLWNDHGTRKVCPGGPEPIFRRLSVDPGSGQPWALDLYGNLYHSPSERGWTRDERFVSVSQSGGTVYDIARDLAISASGSVSLLDCYGRIWSASLDSPEVKGPLEATHYWPRKPVGQSLQADSTGFTVVDRFGGVYLSPWPTSPAVLALRGSHLFPRSLPRRDPDVVDHVFLSDKRWIYLLTKSGRILTNTRWHGVWAE
ncbi:MAG: O-antigen ligase family protein [Candidatus Omnitrophica bacterium]|nr:O-antigen ligase family protein [Candidatus Omnitrophota bacterium]